MKSSKQRRGEIRERRAERKKRSAVRAARDRRQWLLHYADAADTSADVPVSPKLLERRIGLADPDFLQCGTYRDRPFTCVDCGTHEVWTATQQKWWYEVAMGDLNSTAVRCRACRRREKARKAEARRVRLEGVARKAARSKP